MRIDKELCGICMACASVCPRNAVIITEHEAIVNNQLCNDCGVCIKVCPVGAITIDESAAS
ncbi:MAG: 4Fe-4S binding protein [Candidatus Freyarchaeota archaeon]|nr:4Fe-4S binding protein [Candidatus Freyarchaeota archaeon]MDO8091479.1 4Fe-4S binding protein [Candidatus Sigynarchaeota archaeon]